MKNSKNKKWVKLKRLKMYRSELKDTNKNFNFDN